ncbi:hypothetical protein BDF14DRAFT_1001471 [Spinellus fusiger]|nr:hypothetical protein BDF14DRAFT_1001471 [Spinellus fusiger]
MPSFPGLSLVSFIPWRLTSNPNPDPVPENSITESTERVIDESMDTSAQELPTEPSSFVSSFNAFMRYFSKEKKNMQEDEIQHPDTHVVGWDPLHEQTREQLLAFCDDLNIHLKDNSLERDDRCNDPHHTNENLVQTNNSHNNHNHRPCLKLSKTSASPRDIRIITDSPITHFAHSFISPLTSPIESKPSDSLYSASFRHENRHHLVEVLGIDGIRMDTVERARINFDRYSHQRQEKRKSSSGGGMDTLTIPTAHKEKQGDSGSNAPKDLSSEPKSDHSHSTEVAKEPHQNKNKNNSHSSSQEKTSQRNEKEEKEEKDSGNNTLLTDLNKELHAPGPAITSPGKSKEDAAKDATLTKDSTKEEQEEQEQGEEKKNKEEDSKEKEAKQQEALNTLPRAQRIDYVLQPESFMSMIANEYLVGMRAHFSYWTNKDLLWHIVRRLEKLDGVSKEETQTPSVSSSTRTDSNNRRA